MSGQANCRTPPWLFVQSTGAANEKHNKTCIPNPLCNLACSPSLITVVTYDLEESVIGNHTAMRCDDRQRRSSHLLRRFAAAMQRYAVVLEDRSEAISKRT